MGPHSASEMLIDIIEKYLLTPHEQQQNEHQHAQQPQNQQPQNQQQQLGPSQLQTPTALILPKPMTIQDRIQKQIKRED